MELKWQVQGLDELDKALNKLDVAAGKKVLRKAGKAAMGQVQFAMATGAGVDADSSGEHMRDAIKLNTSFAAKGGKDRAVSVRVGPTKKHAQKAIAQEYGTASQIADPFMRPSLFENRERVVNTFKTQLALAIARAVR